MPKKTKKGKKTDRNDKWYKLAKAQGYRSRAAFKLTQLNKKYGFLEKSTSLIDLCAAPGGWCQVASKYMPQGSQIIGLDLLPMRPIPGVTMYDEFAGGDILSSKCRSVLKRDLAGKKTDVVLHDGAPNVGGAWSKDAYGQSELVLMSCKLATEFLRKGGIFITKVFRSSDYNALMWVFNKLFTKVESFKPASSRQQSAEIFVVCQNFIAPDKIDPRLLDPKFAFKQVDTLQPVPDVLHKKVKQKRNRQGYDDNIGVGLFASCSVASFVECDNTEHLQILSGFNVMNMDASATRYNEHKATTDEVRAYFSDLKVLGRSEYKLLLKWRTTMRNAFHLEEAQRSTGHIKVHQVEEEEEEEEDNTPEGRRARLEEAALDHLERLSKKKKREKKKRRELKIKMQKRKDMGIDQHGTQSALQETGDHLFVMPKASNLSRVRSGKDGIASALIPEEEWSEEDDDEDEEEGDEDDEDDEDHEAAERKYLEKLDRDAMSHHQRMKQLKSSRPAVKELTQGQHMIKRKQEAKIAYAEKTAKEEAYRVSEQAGQDYLKLLAANDSDGSSGSSGSDDGNYNSSSEEDVISEDDDSDDDEPSGAAAAARAAAAAAGVGGGRGGRGGRGGAGAAGAGGKRKRVKDSVKDPATAKASASRWFSNPAFAATMPEMTMTTEEEMAGNLLNEAGSEDEGEGDLSHLKLDVGVMPKTDKQIRKDKRKKEVVRKMKKEQRKEKQNKRLLQGSGVKDEDMPGLGMEEVRGEKSDDDDEEDDEFYPEDHVHVSSEHRDLIKAGMGSRLDDDVSTGFSTVPSQVDDNDARKRKRAQTGWSSSEDEDDEEQDDEPVVDPRPNKIGDVEDGYSSDDEMRAHTLAMGTLMAFSHARAKEMIDASYNRYAFTDTNLPEWFVEDEQEHNRPQMPVTKEMVQASKQRFIDLNAAPIKKVAEARARKKMRLAKAVEKAKRLANRIAEDTDMSTRSKMRAIEKAMGKSRVQKTGSVTVRVTRSNGARSSGKGKDKSVRVKFADKRMRSDQRGMDRAMKGGKGLNKRRKGGGKGKHRSRHFN